MDYFEERQRFIDETLSVTVNNPNRIHRSLANKLAVFFADERSKEAIRALKEEDRVWLRAHGWNDDRPWLFTTDP